MYIFSFSYYIYLTTRQTDVFYVQMFKLTEVSVPQPRQTQTLTSDMVGAGAGVLVWRQDDDVIWCAVRFHLFVCIHLQFCL